MIDRCVIKWGDHSPRTLRMHYYKEMKQMQFDVSDDLNLNHYVVSNIKVVEAKLIRDRLNDFIKEVENEAGPNPDDPHGNGTL